MGSGDRSIGPGDRSMGSGDWNIAIRDWFVEVMDFRIAIRELRQKMLIRRLLDGLAYLRYIKNVHIAQEGPC